MTVLINPDGPGPGPRHIVLLGLMASGKSTVGRALAQRWGRSFVDNDAQLMARTGHSAREIAESQGAEVLHVREAEALIDALGAPVPAVVAAAAGAVLEPDAIAALRDELVVYLRAAPEVLVARLERVPASDDHRPFVAADARAVLDAQFSARDARYRQLATVTVDAGREPDEVVDAIIAALG